MHCASKTGKIYDEKYCEKREKPELSRPCNATPCDYSWFSSQWTKCSAICGKGIQNRVVLCGKLEGNAVQKADESKCDASEKPLSERECESPEECPAQWFAGPWSACSKQCGGGSRNRKVICLGADGATEATKCEEDKILFASEDCNTEACVDDELLPVDTTSKPLEEDDESEEWCDSDYDEPLSTEETSESQDGVVKVTIDDSELTTGIDFSSVPSTEASPLTEELMLSDATGLETDVTDSDATTDVTVEGSGSTGDILDLDARFDGSGSDDTTSEKSTSSDSSSTPESDSSSPSSDLVSLGSTESATTQATTEESEISESTQEASSSEKAATTSESITDTSTKDEETTTHDETSTSEDSTTSIEETTSESVSSTSDSSTTEETSESSTPSETTEAVKTESTTRDLGDYEIQTSSFDYSTEISTEVSEELTKTSSEDESTPTTQASETSSTAETQTEETSESSENTTEVTESESEGTTATDVTSETDSTTEGVTEVTQTDESTVSGDDTTLSGEDTTEEIDSTTSSDIDSSTVDIWSTTSDYDEVLTTTSAFEQAVRVELTPKKCKPRPKKAAACLVSDYGCCPDNKTAAEGPFNEGCVIQETCKDTKFNCCPDGVTPAKGVHGKGCPKEDCKATLFGCCPDGVTSSKGNNNEECPVPTTTVAPTTTTTIKPTAKTKPGKDTTKKPTAKPKVEGCAASKYGCCQDNKTEAKGPNQSGCSPCINTQFGCCPDEETPAHGPLREGCCLLSPYGCCPDNINEARGPSLEGCGCEYSPYGCCPDGKTSAKGRDNEGCGCKYTPHGCCPDEITSAAGEAYDGCPCHAYQFGCCPDGVTVATGPHNQGCHCTSSEFKCCSDNITPAKGSNFEGCSCATSQYGCCPNGVTEAKGNNFEECEDKIPESPQKACSLTRDMGTCSDNYTVKYFFDSEYGGCSRFWYGGCGGNKNRFESEGECKETCVEPSGKDVCHLPKIHGPCTGYYPMWHYDSDRNTCTQFIYGGCLGNTNRFEKIEDCQAQCVVDDKIRKQFPHFPEIFIKKFSFSSSAQCDQPIEQGVCSGSFERWGYDKERDACIPFNYGGCKGNKNNYPTENSCDYHCKKPGVGKSKYFPFYTGFMFYVGFQRNKELSFQV